MRIVRASRLWCFISGAIVSQGVHIAMAGAPLWLVALNLSAVLLVLDVEDGGP